MKDLEPTRLPRAISENPLTVERVDDFVRRNLVDILFVSLAKRHNLACLEQVQSTLPPSHPAHARLAYRPTWYMLIDRSYGEKESQFSFCHEVVHGIYTRHEAEDKIHAIPIYFSRYEHDKIAREAAINRFRSQIEKVIDAEAHRFHVRNEGYAQRIMDGFSEYHHIQNMVHNLPIALRERHPLVSKALLLEAQDYARENSLEIPPNAARTDPIEAGLYLARVNLALGYLAGAQRCLYKLHEDSPAEHDTLAKQTAEVEAQWRAAAKGAIYTPLSQQPLAHPSQAIAARKR